MVRSDLTVSGHRPDPPRSLSAPGLRLPAGEPRTGAQTLEQMLTDVTTHDSSPFGDLPEGDPSVDQRPAVDVSVAAMSRLRTPFGVETDAVPQGEDHGQRS